MIGVENIFLRWNRWWASRKYNIHGDRINSGRCKVRLRKAIMVWSPACRYLWQVMEAFPGKPHNVLISIFPSIFPYFQAYFHISKHISTFQSKFPHFQEDFLRDSKSIPGKVFKSANIWPAVSFDPKSVNAWYQRKLSQRTPLQCLQKHNFLFSLPSLKGFRLDRCALEKGVGQSFSAKLPTQNVPPCMPMRPLNPCYFQQILGKNWNILEICKYCWHVETLLFFLPWERIRDIWNLKKSVIFVLGVADGVITPQ